MFKPMYTALMVFAGIGILAPSAGATTIRTAGPNDPHLDAATYSYSAYTSGTTDQYYQGDILDGDSKHTPVSGSVTGHRAVIYGGNSTTINSSAHAETSNDHFGMVRASVQTTNDGTDARAAIFYDFTLVGPDAAYVPVTISAYGSTHLSPGPGGRASAEATMIVNYIDPLTHSQTGLIQDVSSYEHHPFETTINVKPNLTSGTGAPSIYLSVRATAGIDIGGVTGSGPDISYYSGAAESFIDPLLSIADPKLASLYTIVVSLSSVPDGIGPVSPVPLPASAPLFAAALLTLGMIGYRRTRGTAAAAA